MIKYHTTLTKFDCVFQGETARALQQRQQNMQREWVTTLTADDKLISSPLMSDAYNRPVATMSESTVVVYYQCDPIGKQKTSECCLICRHINIVIFYNVRVW